MLCCQSGKSLLLRGLNVALNMSAFTSSTSFGKRGSKGRLVAEKVALVKVLLIRRLKVTHLSPPARPAVLKVSTGAVPAPKWCPCPTSPSALAAPLTPSTRESRFTFVLWVPGSCGETRPPSHSLALRGPWAGRGALPLTAVMSRPSGQGTCRRVLGLLRLPEGSFKGHMKLLGPLVRG